MAEAVLAEVLREMVPDICGAGASRPATDTTVRWMAVGWCVMCGRMWRGTCSIRCSARRCQHCCAGRSIYVTTSPIHPSVVAEFVDEQLRAYHVRHPVPAADIHDVIADLIIVDVLDCDIPLLVKACAAMAVPTLMDM